MERTWTACISNCSLDDYETVVDVYNEQSFKDDAFYVLATRNGMIKKSNVSLFKTTRYNKPLDCYES